MPYRFTGQELDQETKLYYYGARYYDPKTSAWQNPDPALGRYLNTTKTGPRRPTLGSDWRVDTAGIGLGGVFNPRNLNGFGYAHQSPARITDPNGKFGEATAIGCAVTVEAGCAPGALVGLLVDVGLVLGIGTAIAAVWYTSDYSDTGQVTEMAGWSDIVKNARAGWENYKMRMHNGLPGPEDPHAETAKMLLLIAGYYLLPNQPSIDSSPSLPEYKGGGTAGVLRINGNDITLTSGYAGPSSMLPDTGNPGMNGNIRSHVEAHAAAIMSQTGAKSATLYLNNPPCGGTSGCGAMLQRMLPPGATLNVYGPNGYYQSFTGAAGQ